MKLWVKGIDLDQLLCIDLMMALTRISRDKQLVMIEYVVLIYARRNFIHPWLIFISLLAISKTQKSQLWLVQQEKREVVISVNNEVWLRVFSLDFIQEDFDEGEDVELSSFHLVNCEGLLL